MLADVVDRWRTRSQPGDAKVGCLRVALDGTPLLGVRTGVGVFTSCVLEALGSRPDLQVAAFAVSWRTRGQLAGQLPPSVTFVDRPMPARPAHLAWRWLNAPPIEWWTGRLDVVHGTNFTVPPARHAARVVTVHDLTVVRFPEMVQPATLSYPRLLRLAIGQGAYVHTPSEFVAREVVELLGASPDRVRAVHHGVPPVATFSGTAPPAPLGVEGRFILALGTVEPRKDYPTLVAAFDQLAGSRPDLRLVIAGADGWGSQALEAALGQARHRDRVLRLGWIANQPRDQLLAAATVLAYPSVYEGFGLPPLEAMAAGVAVVATDAGALPEVLGDGAAMVPVGDALALADALSRVIDDEDARAELIRRGRARARTFTWEHSAAGLSALYHLARNTAG